MNEDNKKNIKLQLPQKAKRIKSNDGKDSNDSKDISNNMSICSDIELQISPETNMSTQKSPSPTKKIIKITFIH